MRKENIRKFQDRLNNSNKVIKTKTINLNFAI